MNQARVESFLRSGIWTTPHDLYSQAAFRALDRLLKEEEECLRTEERLKAKGEEPSVISYLTMAARENMQILSVSVEIFCCMSVEAFLNFYGVVRLGEEFFKRNYERLGITQKLEALLATCQGVKGEWELTTRRVDGIIDIDCCSTCGNQV